VTKTERPLGYAPITWNNVKVDIKYDSIIVSKIDPLNYHRFLEIINWSKEYGFKLIVVNSPKAIINSNNNITISKLCNENNIVYIDNSNLDIFRNNPGLFSDWYHLYYKGADIYTKMFIEQIKPYIENLK
jgi:hypothetical protein